MLNLVLTSSLEKVLPKTNCDAMPIEELCALQGEKVSFQAAFAIEPITPYYTKTYEFRIDAQEGVEIESYFVKNVPVGLTTFLQPVEDEDFIIEESGLCPDLLVPVDRDWVQINHIYQSMWFSFKAPAGKYTVTLTFKDTEGEDVVSKSLVLNVLPATLPKQELVFTQWFHTDCIAAYYKYETFSEEHWEMIEKFARMAYENGMNMILTPIFTPPLDTQIGGERPTTQLLKIQKDGDKYSFDFSKLLRWVNMCKEIGIEYFEMPHLFTQWGAKATPKIVAFEGGEEKKVFGWDVKASSVEYDNFLSQMLPSLLEFLKQNEILEKTYFHISDEPSLAFADHLESYGNAKKTAGKYLKGVKVIDAISDFEFFKKGLIEIPVSMIEHLKPFLETDLAERWCYYCCLPCKGTTNRFIAMPSSRNRSIGFQLYKYKMDGFLQWGYNFYYSERSKRLINPFLETDADGAYPAGDPFSVYPGEKAPIPSLRLLVFNEALQDLRAFKLLEGYIGFDGVVEFLEQELSEKIVFDKCFDAQTILRIRNAVNKKIAELL